MNLRNSITWILQTLLMTLLPISIWQGAYLQAIAVFVAIVLAFLPAIAKRNYRITLPWGFQVLLIVAVFLHVAGLVFGWYSDYSWWDVMTHLIGSATVAILAFLGVYSLYVAGKIHVTIKMIGVFIFVTTMAVGAYWEIAEFAFDELAGTRAQRDNYDTMKDLINDGIAGLLVTIIGIEYIKRNPEARIEKNAEKLMVRLRKLTQRKKK